MSINDPFDDFWDEESADSSPRRGRPRVRQSREKGPIGRPRIRPLEQKYARKRGRPALNSGSIADRIEKEGIISGSYGAKTFSGTFKNFDKSVALLQKNVVTPLSKSISAFSRSVNDFNKYHQQYLKDQIAISKEFHETFKLFRKSSIDPLIRSMARTRKGTEAISEVMKEVYKSGNYSREYKDLYQKISKYDKRLNDMVETSVVGVEMTDTFLKEYYKTSKSTSKFLNAVAYAAEDISEDIESLKDNMAKYFKGKNSNKSILQDQSESLKRIEKNTKAPSIGRRVLSSAFAAGAAALKTMFRFNRYGTTELLSEGLNKLTGGSMKLPTPKQLASGNNVFSKIYRVMDDALAVSIREKVRDAEGQLQHTYQKAYIGGYGPVAQGIAEGATGIQRVFISNLQSMGAKIVGAWNKQETKERARWFWEVAKTMGINWYNREGAIGERQINSVKSNYGKNNYSGPHGGKSVFHSPEDLIRSQRRILDEYERNNFNDYNEAAPLPFVYNPTRGSSGFSFADPVQKNNVIKGPWKNTKHKVDSYGTGPSIVTLDPKSESTLTTANVGTPRKALSSLAKIQGRMLGYIEKLWKNVKGDGTKNKIKDKEGNSWLGKLAAGLGAGGLAGFLMKNRKFLKGKFGGLSLLGSAVFGSHALKRGWKGINVGAAKHAGMRNFGATARTLWDTFGWGSAKGKDSMKALGMFKNTKLGRSALGTMIRQARLASAGMGTGVGSRILGGLIHSNKWGNGTLGAIGGLWHGAGARFVKEEGKLLPRLAFDGRRSISAFAGKGAKAGSRTAAIAQGMKDAKFLAKNPLIGKVLGTGALGGIAAAGKNAIGGIGKVMTKIPSKDKALGGILKAVGGGAALKMLGKIGGKGVAKALAKQIPILGAIVGIGFGIHRFTKGDVLGGILEIVSGLLTLVPSGAGNAAALGIDAFLVGRDIKKATSKPSKKDSPISDKDKKKILNTFGVAAGGGSAVNHVAENQKTAAEAGSTGGNNFDPRIDKQDPFNKNSSSSSGRGFWNSVGSKISTGGKLVGALASGTAGGEKQEVSKDTGSIKWNGYRHDQLMPKFQKKLFSAAADFEKSTGKKVIITSAIRTDQEQANLWYRANVLHDKNVYMPAKPVNDYVINGHKVPGTHNNSRSGHLAGGAVDVQNWNEFAPYAKKYGIRWFGSKDPVHFQIDDKGPAIGVKQVNNYKPASGSNTKVGDGELNGQSTKVPNSVVGSSGNMGPGSSPSVETTISPIIQDWGLSIINNLLFA